MIPPLNSPSGIQLSDSQKLAWLRLIRSENVGPATFIELIKHYGTATDALAALPELVARGRGKQIRLATEGDAEREMHRLHKVGARIICLGEPDYPSALRAADTPPPVLTVMGNATALQRNCVAIVGSRNASLSGKKLTRQFAETLADSGYSIVSGLARGIDTQAHQASLKQGTIAIFAGGIDHIYPSENEQLARDIVDQGGTLVSEMPPGWKPRAQDFPRRNRIVAGMALGLLVVEAANRSGSLISARLANEMGRLVFAVPGSPLDPRSYGTNKLIQQGAQLVTNAHDILQALEPVSQTPLQKPYSLDENKRIEYSEAPDDRERLNFVESLNHSPTDIDELIRYTGLDLGKIQMIILELELAGRVERHSGNRISLI